MASTRSKGTVTLLGVVATGVWADVAPLAHLALGLRRSGFAIKFVTHSVHVARVTALGLSCVGIRGDPQSVYSSVAARDAISSASMLKLASLFQSDAETYVEANMSAIHAAVKDVDGLVCCFSVLTECSAIAQKYQIGLIVATLLPFSPSGEIPVASVLPEPLTYAWLNKLTHDLSGLYTWTLLGGTYNRFRTRTLGIGPQSSYVIDGISQVTAFSPIVVPRPADWDSNIVMTSLWRLPADLDGPPRGQPLLTAFTASPSADANLRPVYVGFDCVPLADPVAFIKHLHACAGKWGVPVILSVGATDVEAARTSPRLEGLDGLLFELPDLRAASTEASLAAAVDAAAAALVGRNVRVLVVGDVSPTWLLPRCSVAVHHGGMSVTQAALEAGIPSVVFPSFAEQYFWAARISALRAGPIMYFPMRQVLEMLDECVCLARHERVRARAREIGEAMRAHGDGVQQAVSAIRATLSRPQNRHCGVICQWAPDDSRDTCTVCNDPFSLTNRRRHCRSCGMLACYRCLGLRCHLPGYPENAPQITCQRCIDSRRAFFAMHVGRSVVPALPDAASTGDAEAAFVTVAAAAAATPAPPSATRAFSTPVLASRGDGSAATPADMMRSDVEGFLGAPASMGSDVGRTPAVRSLTFEPTAPPPPLHATLSFRSPDGHVEALPL